MVKQMVTEHNPQVNNQADAQKTANEGFQKKGQAGSEALSLLLKWTPEEMREAIASVNLMQEGYRLPEVSGFRMSRKV